MLTPRQNFMEVMKGGNPERFVNQFEFYTMAFTPGAFGPQAELGGFAKDAWGVTTHWREGVVNAYPMHGPEYTVVQDITRWQETFIAPPINDNDDDWAPIEAMCAAVNRDEVFLASMIFPGFFEMMHYMMGMSEALANYIEEPELVKQMIDYYLQYLKRSCDVITRRVHPDMLCFSDDLGTAVSSFISPEMFKEFFLEPYKELFGYWREHGAELIYMHNDSYCANLVPYFIEAGIDVWQGVVVKNNCPELVREYGGRIVFMGDIDSGVVDSPYWTPEIVEREVRRACTTNGKLYFVPSMTMAGPPTLFEGVNDCITACIDKMSEEMF